MRAGGHVISGEPFDRFGIPAALGQDAKVHGSDGSLDYTGNLLRNAIPRRHPRHARVADVHRLAGLQHADPPADLLRVAAAGVEAGERLVVAQTVDDEPICRIEPRRRRRRCDETHVDRRPRSAAAGAAGLRRRAERRRRAAAGSGSSTAPAQARQVIAAGKLAVIIGIESSDLFGCSETSGRTHVHARANRPRAFAPTRGSASAACSSRTGSTTRSAAPRSRAAPRASSSTSSTGSRPGRYFTTVRLSGRRPGRRRAHLSRRAARALARFFPAATLDRRAGDAARTRAACSATPTGLTPLGRYLSSG